MSLFPIRLKPGGTITVHLRFSARFPVWINRKDYLINPLGEKKLCYERHIPFIPNKKSEDDVHVIKESRQIFGGAPLLIAARYLQDEVRRSDYFMDMLVGLRDDTHHYYTLTIPEDAPLGRYHFELEDRVNGKVFRSNTVDTDYFLVEQLNLIKVERSGNSFIASVENPSPEPVLAHLCEFSDAKHEYEPKIIQLEPKTITTIQFFETAILLYRDGDEFLRLHTEKSCLRNPVFQPVFRENYIMIFSNDPTHKQAFELENEAEDIWNKANGFIPRSLVRTAANAHRYDEMLTMGIIIEID